MTRPKEAGSYPMFMLDILDRLAANPDIEIEVFFPSEKAGLSFRLDWYSFRSAAIKEGMEKDYPNLKAVSVGVRADGTVTIGHKDHGDVAKRVEAALELARQKALKQGEISTAEIREAMKQNPDVKK